MRNENKLSFSCLIFFLCAEKDHLVWCGMKRKANKYAVGSIDEQMMIGTKSNFWFFVFDCWPNMLHSGWTIDSCPAFFNWSTSPSNNSFFFVWCIFVNWLCHMNVFVRPSVRSLARPPARCRRVYPLRA